jgi:hypothetical protein
VNTAGPGADAATLLANLDRLTDDNIDALLGNLLTRTKS